jgi:hypothetical protein
MGYALNASCFALQTRRIVWQAGRIVSKTEAFVLGFATGIIIAYKNAH